MMMICIGQGVVVVWLFSGWCWYLALFSPLPAFWCVLSCTSLMVLFNIFCHLPIKKKKKEMCIEIINYPIISVVINCLLKSCFRLSAFEADTYQNYHFILQFALGHPTLCSPSYPLQNLNIQLFKAHYQFIVQFSIRSVHPNMKCLYNVNLYTDFEPHASFRSFCAN